MKAVDLLIIVCEDLTAFISIQNINQIPEELAIIESPINKVPLLNIRDCESCLESSEP